MAAVSPRGDITQRISQEGASRLCPATPRFLSPSATQRLMHPAKRGLRAPPAPTPLTGPAGTALARHTPFQHTTSTALASTSRPEGALAFQVGCTPSTLPSCDPGCHGGRALLSHAQLGGAAPQGCGTPLPQPVKVVGVGSAGVDYLASVAAYPRPDEKLRTDTLEVGGARERRVGLHAPSWREASAWVPPRGLGGSPRCVGAAARAAAGATHGPQVQGGGNCANALTAAARLGLTPYILSKVGGWRGRRHCWRGGGGGLHLHPGSTSGGMATWPPPVPACRSELMAWATASSGGRAILQAAEAWSSPWPAVQRVQRLPAGARNCAAQAPGGLRLLRPRRRPGCWPPPQ
jgi:hypothetical protein